MRFLRVFWVVLAAAPAALRADSPVGTRLPRDVVPSSEAVRLEADPSSTGYKGSVRVDVEVRRAVASFPLHAAKLRVTRLSLVPSTKGAAPLAAAWESAGEDRLEVRTEAPLVPGRYRLELDFTNDYDTTGDSLYRVVAGGEPYLFTQFEDIAARRAFPCWDEPSFKIPWQVTLVVRPADVALSNTAVEHESIEGGRKTVVFRRTKPLPSYLVAMAVGPFESVPVPGTSIPTRIVTVKGQSALATDAVRTTGPILAELEKYFGERYPYDKLDLIAAPEYWYGAMENPGLLVSKDTRLLLDPALRAPGDVRELAGTTAHELAHMWFGDLVTMAWWDDLWLNESFASWAGDKICDRAFPEMRLGEESVFGMLGAMTSDSRISTHAMRQPVTAQESLLEAADDLAYAKGQAVIGMFERWLGETTFRKGVLLYLKTHRWGNATGADLWGALERVSGKPVAAAMATFLDQPGVPWVSAEPRPDGKVVLRQRRFLVSADPAAAADPATWRIPVTLRFPSSKGPAQRTILLTGPEQVVDLGAGVAPPWIHPNADEAGYYRWSVPPSVRTMLARNAASLLTPRERVGFLGNLEGLLGAGAISGPDWLETVRGFGVDPDPLVLDAFVDALGAPSPPLGEGANRGPWKAFLRAALAPVAARIGTRPAPGEDPRVTDLRPRVLTLLGAEAGDRAAIAVGEEMARAWLADRSSLDPSLAPAALALAAREGGRDLFETYRRRFEAATTPAERSLFLSALGAFRDPALVEAALDYALTGPLRATEINRIPGTISRDVEWRERVFRWALEHHDAIVARIPAEMASLQPYYAGGCSRERLAEAKRFFEDPAHQAPGTRSSLAKVAAEVEECATVRDREAAGAAAWFAREGLAR